MSTNIDYWEKVTRNPTQAYKNLFNKEEQYLQTHISLGSRILDIGCGDGRTILSLLHISQNIDGIDNDKKAVEDAKLNLKDYSAINIQEASAQNIFFNDHTFDCVVLMMTLVNFGDEKKKTLMEMKRVLKNSGKIIISVYSEKALNERLDMYKQIEVPITKVEHGYVTFDESVGAHTSEQFSKNELNQIVRETGLTITDIEEVENLAYIFTLELK